MKIQNKILVILATVLGVIATTSAQMRTAYFMEGSYFRTDMNAALVPYRGYIKMPGIGGLGINLSNNYLSVNNFFHKHNGGVYTFMDNSISSGEFLKKLGNKGKISLNVNNSLIGFAAHAKKFFWSFDLNLRSNTEVTLSKDMFSALKNLSNGYYDLGDTHLYHSTYLEAAVGFALPIKDFITFGFRVKGLVGIADFSGSMDKMYIDANRSIINAQYSYKAQSNLPLKSGSILSADNFKNGGIAFDLGFEFRFLDDHLKVSVAANDIGFIRWQGNNMFNAKGKGYFSYEGYDLEADKAKINNGTEGTTGSSAGAYTTRLSCSLNGGIEYNILNNHIAFGLLSHTQFCQNFTRTELTASVNFRVCPWFTTSVSHTFLNGNKFGVLGWALNFHPVGFNFFLGADFIDTRYAVINGAAVPKMMSSANFYFGLGFNLGKSKWMKPPQVPVEKKAKAKKQKKS